MIEPRIVTDGGKLFTFFGSWMFDIRNGRRRRGKRKVKAASTSFVTL